MTCYGLIPYASFILGNVRGCWSIDACWRCVHACLLRGRQGTRGSPQRLALQSSIQTIERFACFFLQLWPVMSEMVTCERSPRACFNGRRSGEHGWTDTSNV